jgi:FtsP/CotA-like multicopper oxidase with cupredoxin domain
MWRRLIPLLLLVGVAAGCGSSKEDAPDVGAHSQRQLAQAMAQSAGNIGKLTFENDLQIPPVLNPRRGTDGSRVFDLTLRTGSRMFLPGKRAETWGVNGDYLGPTLRASRGDRIVLNVKNHLPESTTMHWHGMHLPAKADGGPHQLVAPGTTWSPSWTVDQPAATLWYHPHPHGKTADDVYRGLAGLFFVDDPASASLALPHTYGVDDIPLVIQDKRFQADGSLDFSQPLISPTGRLGEQILINGTYNPHLRVRHQRTRFRLLNASNARIYNVGFVDGRTFQLIATDGGLLEAPERLTRIQLSPGERAEIVAAFRPGERVLLRSFPPQLGTNFMLERLTGGDDSFDLLQIRGAATLAHSREIPPHLSPLPHLHADHAPRTRRFELSDQLEINGKKMDMGRFDAVVTAGATEIWEVHNGSPLPHSFHVHDVRFRVLEYAGAAPPPQLKGLKDTVYVPSGSSVRVLIRFGEYADPTAPYMFHCHLLQHEDHGMMGQFVVVKPGQTVRPPHDGHEHAAR